MHVCTIYKMGLRERDSQWWTSKVGWAVLAAVVPVLLSCFAPAQTETPGLPTLPSTEQVIQRNQDPYLGSIPQGKLTPGVIDLTVEDALDRMRLRYKLEVAGYVVMPEHVHLLLSEPGRDSLAVGLQALKLR